MDFQSVVVSFANIRSEALGPLASFQCSLFSW